MAVLESWILQNKLVSIINIIRLMLSNLIEIHICESIYFPAGNRYNDEGNENSKSMEENDV